MKKLLIDRKKFINWYVDVDTDFIDQIYEALVDEGEYRITAQQLLDTAGYIPEQVLVTGQEYELDDNDDVITSGFDLITFNSDPPKPDLSGATIEDLKKELTNRGYFTDNMWHKDDVESQLAYYNEENPDKKQLTIDDIDWNGILYGALTNDWIIEQINVSIYNEISE